MLATARSDTADVTTATLARSTIVSAWWVARGTCAYVSRIRVATVGA